MPEIHPTAMVDPRARLGEGVTIGPWCRVEGDVALGPGCRLLERVSLMGPLSAGARNTFYPGVCVGLPPQHRKFDASFGGPGVVIGDDNVLREGASIHRATGDAPTRLGHDNYLMVNSHLGHDAAVGDGCTLANNVLLAGHATVGDGVTFGGGAGLHQFARVGRLAIVGGLVGLSQDVPPFCACYYMRRVGSLNLVGLRRNGYRDHVPALRRAFDLQFRSGHSAPRAVERIRAELGDDPLCREFADFIAVSQRGITRYGKRGNGGEESV